MEMSLAIVEYEPDSLNSEFGFLLKKERGQDNKIKLVSLLSDIFTILEIN